MPTLQQLKKIISENFSPPFVKDGLVIAEMGKEDGKKVLCLSIGGRDVSIAEDGEVLSSGTFLG